MTLTDTVNNIANFVVLAYLIPLVAFIFLYATRSPWKVTELGQALMVQKLALTIIVVVLCFSYFLGVDYPGREYIRLFAFFAVFITLIIDVANLLRYQRTNPRAKKKASHK